MGKENSVSSIKSSRRGKFESNWQKWLAFGLLLLSNLHHKYIHFIHKQRNHENEFIRNLVSPYEIWIAIWRLKRPVFYQLEITNWDQARLTMSGWHASQFNKRIIECHQYRKFQLLAMLITLENLNHNRGIKLYSFLEQPVGSFLGTSSTFGR